MLDVQPLTVRLILKPKGVPDKVGSIYIPTTSKEMEATEGEVIAIGPDVTTVSVGDSVFYGRYAGNKFERDGEKYELMNEDDLLGKVIQIQS